MLLKMKVTNYLTVNEMKFPLMLMIAQMMIKMVKKIYKVQIPGTQTWQKILLKLMQMILKIQNHSTLAPLYSEDNVELKQMLS